MKEIREVGGECSKDPEKIASSFRKFYQNLYSGGEDILNGETTEAYLETLSRPRLEEEMCQSMEAPISHIEVIAAINSLVAGKATGLAGYTVGFYKRFCGILAPKLANLYNSILKGQALPPSLLQASIVVIPKEGKDPRYCSAYRPISLLNIDAKILSKIIAKRIMNLLPLLVHGDQVGFIENRQGADNIRKTIDLIHEVQGRSIPSVVLSLDAEKAFDRVSWPFLFTVMEKMGFGPNLLRWIRAFYVGPTDSVFVNGISSVMFQLQRGTRHCCPLSLLLFVLTMEPFALAIRRNPFIKGIQAGEGESKLALFADDVLMYLTDPVSSLRYVMMEIKRFGECSGL